MFTRKQPEQNAPMPAPAPRQIDPASVEHALSAIGVFAQQMQELTQLFVRGHQDMARQFDETQQRLERAVVSVAAGEARIAAQVSAFERVAGDALRAASDHERAARDLFEQFRRTTSELAADSIRPLKAEVESVSRHLSDATARVSSAAGGFAHAMDAAIGSVNARAERMLERQTDAVAEALADTMETGRAAMAAAGQSLDAAAGALARRMLATSEAQDAKLRAFEALTERFDALKAALPTPDATAANARRIEEATAAMSQASAGVTRAVGEILMAKTSEADAAARHAAAVESLTAGQEDISRRLAGIAATADRAGAEAQEAFARIDGKLAEQSTTLDDIGAGVALDGEAGRETRARLEAMATRQLDVSRALGALTETMDAAFRRNAEQSAAALDAVSGRIGALQAGLNELVTIDGEGRRQILEAVAGLESEREAMKRMTIAVRMMAKEATAENERASASVGALAGQLEALAQSLGDSVAALRAKAETPISAQAASAGEQSAAGLPFVTGEKESFQRVLAGFRLLLRDIGGESARLRELIDGVSGKMEGWTPVAAQASPAPSASTPPAPEPHPEIAAKLSAIAEAVDAVGARIDAIRGAEPDDSPVVDGRPAASLPPLHGERESMQRLLVGFRLQLKELDAQTGALRDRIAGIRQPETLVLAPEVDAGLLAPLQGAAERIAEGVAETLSQLEQRLTEPVMRLTDAVADNARLLLVARDAMAAPAAAPARKPALAVDDAVAAMQDAARAIDKRIGHVDALLATLKRGGAVPDDALRDLVSGMEAAAGDLKREAGDFLAIGAALSHELEAGTQARSSASGAGRRKAAGIHKLRA